MGGAIQHEIGLAIRIIALLWLCGSLTLLIRLGRHPRFWTLTLGIGVLETAHLCTHMLASQGLLQPVMERLHNPLMLAVPVAVWYVAAPVFGWRSRRGWLWMVGWALLTGLTVLFSQSAGMVTALLWLLAVPAAGAFAIQLGQEGQRNRLSGIAMGLALCGYLILSASAAPLTALDGMHGTVAYTTAMSVLPLTVSLLLLHFLIGTLAPARLERCAPNVFFTALMLALSAIFTGLGGWMAQSSAHRTEVQIRERLLTDARIASATFEQLPLSELNGTANEIHHPVYRSLHERLGRIRTLMPEIRYAYVVTMRHNTIVFNADSEPSSSTDYLPPGVVYHEASDALRRSLVLGRTATHGPYRDRWGEWVGAILPLSAPGKRMAFCMDIPAEALRTRVSLARTSVLWWTVVTVLLITAGFFVIAHLQIVSVQHLLNEQRFRTLFNSAPEPACIYDPVADRLVAANDRLAAWSGWSTQEITQGQAETLAQAVVLIIQVQGQQPVPVHLRRGETATVMGSYSAVTYQGQGALLVYLHDITHEQQQAQTLERLNEDLRASLAAVEESQALLRVVMDSIASPMYYKDVDGRYLGVNRAFEEFFGITAEDIVGHDSTVLLEEPQLTLFNLYDEQLLQSGSTQVFEEDVRRADGALRRLVFRRAAFRNVNGDIAGITAVIQDITERYRMQQQLSENRDRLARLLELSADLVFETDTEYRFRFVSDQASRVLGRYPEEFLGEPLWAFMPDAEGADLQRTLAEWNTETRLRVPEMTALHRDGHAVILELSAAPIVGSDGAVTGLRGVARDITQRTRAERRIRQTLSLLEAANTDLRAFTRAVSHNLKTHVRAISMMSQWAVMDSEEALPANVVDGLTEIQRRATSLDALMDSFLELAEASLERETPELCPMRELIVQAQRDVGTPTHITVTISADMPEIYVEPTRMRTAFRMLFDNALRFAASEVSVSVTQDAAGNWEFVLADDGPGVAPELRATVFRRFETLEGAEVKGTGLAVAKRIIESHAGSIWLEDTPPGMGARFHVRLPAEPG